MSQKNEEMILRTLRQINTGKIEPNKVDNSFWDKLIGYIKQEVKD